MSAELSVPTNFVDASTFPDLSLGRQIFSGTLKKRKRHSDLFEEPLQQWRLFGTGLLIPLKVRENLERNGIVTIMDLVWKSERQLEEEIDAKDYAIIKQRMEWFERYQIIGPEERMLRALYGLGRLLPVNAESEHFLRVAVAGVLADFSGRQILQRRILELEFGLTDGVARSLLKIEGILHNSHVWNLEYKAIKRLREPEVSARFSAFAHLIGPGAFYSKASDKRPLEFHSKDPGPSLREVLRQFQVHPEIGKDFDRKHEELIQNSK